MTVYILPSLAICSYIDIDSPRLGRALKEKLQPYKTVYKMYTVHARIRNRGTKHVRFVYSVDCPIQKIFKRQRIGRMEKLNHVQNA